MTWTAMRSAVPPRTSVVTPVIPWMMDGETARRPRKTAPGKVMRLTTRAM